MKGVPKLLLNEHFEDATGVYGTEFDKISRRPVRVYFEWHFCWYCQNSIFLHKYQAYLSCLSLDINRDFFEIISCDAKVKMASKSKRILQQLLHLTSNFSLQILNHHSYFINFAICLCQYTYDKTYMFKMVQTNALRAIQRYVSVFSFLGLT